MSISKLGPHHSIPSAPSDSTVIHVGDALDVERRCPATLSAAALELAPPLDVSNAAPLELHRLDVVKTLGGSTCTWMQGDGGGWIKLI